MPLKIDVPAGELYGAIDPETGRKMFTKVEATTLTLEHSLISLAKWEAKWHKPYISSEKSNEETIDYIRCMTTTQNVDPNVYKVLTRKNIEDIMAYIEDPHTATKVPEIRSNSTRHDVVTAELIYYWMISYNIPVEFQKWHLNKLITLIRVFNFKNAPAKKMSTSELYSRNSALNRARRAKFNSKG